MSDVADEPAAAPAAEQAAAAGPPAGLAMPGRRRPGVLPLVLLLIAGLAGLGGGGGALAAELTRHATPAEIAAAGRAEIASRWQRLTAGQLFPATIGYFSADGAAMVAARAGIAPPASCRAALDPRVYSLLRRRGCQTVLRASYLDSSGTVAATIGVVVMSRPVAVQPVLGRLPGNAGVRVPSFPGTSIALAGNAQRLFADSPMVDGRYLLFTAAGATDGRPAADLVTGDPADMEAGIADRELAILTGGPPPCSREDIRC